MIIVQTPLRISLFGGGTDFPSFYHDEGGAVLTSAIDKYIFVIIKQRFDQKLRIGYTSTEMVDSIDQVQHELIREALRKTGITRRIEVVTMGDIPSAGSGLGSSSTVTVGSLHAMYAYRGEMISTDRLAREACEIEIVRLGKPIGVQDQYIAAYGGFRFIEFLTNGEIRVNAVSIDPGLKRRLNDNLMLFYTGVDRSSEEILTEQKNNIQDHMLLLKEMKQMAYHARDELQAGNVEIIGKLLHQSWQMKKKLSSRVSNPTIDHIYEAARHAGAAGGKITGAGGGGFFLFYCPHEKQDSVREALPSLQELPFQLEPFGTKVIFEYR